MEGTLREQINTIATASYDVVEVATLSHHGPGTIREWLHDAGLDVIAMVFYRWRQAYRVLPLRGRNVSDYGPIQITSQSGKDFWDTSQRREFFEKAIEIEHRMGIDVDHETHWGEGNV